MASVSTPVVSAPSLVTIAPAKAARTRTATAPPAAPVAAPAVVPVPHVQVPAVDVPAVEVPPVDVPVPTLIPDTSSVASTSLEPRLVDGVHGLVRALVIT
jgi:hypothetical protein